MASSRRATVPNDNYTRDESHKLLTFVVPRTARVTVLTRGIHSTPVTVAEFAQLLKGRNPRHRPLFGPPAGWGYWALVNIDRVRSLDAQAPPETIQSDLRGRGKPISTGARHLRRRQRSAAFGRRGRAGREQLPALGRQYFRYGNSGRPSTRFDRSMRSTATS